MDAKSNFLLFAWLGHGGVLICFLDCQYGLVTFSGQAGRGDHTLISICMDIDAGV